MITEERPKFNYQDPWERIEDTDCLEIKDEIEYNEDLKDIRYIYPIEQLEKAKPYPLLFFKKPKNIYKILKEIYPNINFKEKESKKNGK